MFAPLNGAPLNGGASGLWAEATAECSAVASATAYVERYTSATATAQAESLGEAQRTARVVDASTTGEADTAGAAIRYAYLSGASTGEAQSEGRADRFAWMIASQAEAQAASSSTSVRWRLVTAVAEAAADTSLDPVAAEVAAYANPRSARATARTWVDESLTTRKRVRQRYATATAVARSHTRVIANAKLGRGTATGTAESSLDAAKLRVYRAARGTMSAESELRVDSNRIRIITLGAIAEAFTYIAPTVIKADGTRLSYAHAVAEAQAVTSATALGITPAEPMLFAGEALVQVDSFLARGMRASAFAESASQGEGRVNAWARARGTAIGESDSTAQGLRYRWVGATGDSPVRAESTAVNRVYRWAQGQPTIAEASSSLEALRRAPMQGVAQAEAQLALDTTTYAWRYVSGVAEAEASSQADGLRIVWMDSPPLIGKAAGRAPTFKINASDPAPLRRVIVLPPGDRSFALPASDREYRVA